MTVVGTVESVWRYPVKSMRGEQIPEAFVAFAGVMGDRVYSFVRDGGNPGFPWHTAREQAALLLYEPRYKNHDATLKPPHLDDAQALAPGINPLYPDADQFSVEVKTPSGEVFGVDENAFLEHLKAVTQDPSLTLKFTQRSQYDCRPLALFSLQCANMLATELDTEIDKRRFRANLYINWSNDTATDTPYEVELIGKRLKIGDQLEISILERDPRCKMITLDPDTADANPDIIKHVSSTHNGYAGVYGAVLVEGIVKAGDPIKVEL
ncbi:MAG: MOSC N-terminal beta barrel domain-containing protein [Cyanobacteria bacterium J06632_22]